MNTEEEQLMDAIIDVISKMTNKIASMGAQISDLETQVKNLQGVRK